MLQEIFSGLTVWHSTLFSFGAMFIAIIVGMVAYAFLFHMLDRGAKLGWAVADRRMIARWEAPSRFILPLICIAMVTPYLWVQEEIKDVLGHAFELLLVASGSWLLINTVLGVQEITLGRYDREEKDNLKARAVHTQVNLLVNVFIIVIIILAIAAGLMTFTSIRRIGFSILASAGVIGIITGIAAQKSIANLIAGIQIALSQPIRIDDVVIVEGEWGEIEKITLTHVVVRIWDLRRIVVPISFFVEKPFQNWTHVGSNLIGTVFLHADYTVPVKAMREELRRILDHAPWWNGKAWALHVTDAKERTIELRAMVSADNAGSLWELRCHVREGLTEFLKLRYPECLPRLRAEMSIPSPPPSDNT